VKEGAGGTRYHLAPPIVVGLLIVAYMAVLGTMSLRRHQNLHTNALDLGYTDQAVWNTLHGRPFRFSTYLDAAFRLDIPIQDFREPGVLLGYHVEPILALIAPLYLLHDGPETLLWLQTVGIALGAVPVYLLARHRFARREPEPAPGIARHAALWIPVAFVLIYLLAPPLEAANMSDFHAVALSPALLLTAFYFLETDRPWAFVATAFLATMCKEEVGLLVAMMGLWGAFVRRRWVLGLGVAVAAATWSLLSLMVITPHFTGLQASAFVIRYEQFGDDPADILLNLVRAPGLFLGWLFQPDVLRYLRDLWLAGGGLPVLYPLALAMALPSVAINAFSVYGWMRSGGGHYSASIVPFLLISAIYGVAWAAGAVDRRVNGGAGGWWGSTRGQTTPPGTGAPSESGAIDRRVNGGQGGWRGSAYWIASLVLVGVGLGIALVNHYHNGISPPSRRFSLQPLSEHARRAQPLIEQVNQLPPEVPISASSGLYPHVGHRERAYLFPTVSDAQFILLDVTGPPSPASVDVQRQIVGELLEYGQFGVAASDHGFLLLERGLDQYRFSPTFYDAFQAEGATPQVAMGADFGGLLKLEGFDWDVRPVVRPALPVEITTYWRALSPIDGAYRLVFYFWDDEQHRVLVQPEEMSVHWYSTWLWEPGQMVKLTLPPLPVGDLPHAGVALLRPGTSNLEIEGRVVPITSTASQPWSLWEEGTLLELVRP